MSFLGFGKSGDAVSNNTEMSSISNNSQIVEQIKSEISQEIATAYASALVNALSESCFEKCPNGADSCVSDCTTKFMRAWNVVSRSYVQRINQK